MPDRDILLANAQLFSLHKTLAILNVLQRRKKKDTFLADAIETIATYIDKQQRRLHEIQVARFVKHQEWISEYTKTKTT